MSAVEKPSTRRTDLIAVAIFLVAVVIAALIGYRAITGFLAVTDDLTRVVVPGTTEIAFTETGNYTIFYEHRSTIDGRVFRTPDTLRGLRVALLSLETGAPIAISSPGSDVEYSLRGRSGVSVLAFSIDRPGTYELTAFYENNATAPEVVLAIGQDVGRQIVVSVLSGLGAVAIFLIATGAAIALAVVPRVRRKQHTP